MAHAETAQFGDLLRQHRTAAGLTQEALAERAALSVHGLQKLERGVTRPDRDTAQRLVSGLELRPADDERLRAEGAPQPRQTFRQHMSPTAVRHGGGIDEFRRALV
jgi:transcriptional regulator with XRE-family HTH domain